MKTLQQYKSEEFTNKNPVILSYLDRNAIRVKGGKVINDDLLRIARISGSVLNSIQYPKKGGGIPFRNHPNAKDFSRCVSGVEMQDIIGMVTETLAERDSFNKPDLEWHLCKGKKSCKVCPSCLDWLACKRKVESVDTGLSLSRRETYDVSELAAFQSREKAPGETCELPQDTGKILARFADLENCIAMAYKIDVEAKSKQAEKSMKKARYLLNLAKRYALGECNGNIEAPKAWREEIGDHYTSESKAKARDKAHSARKASRRFFEAYIARGQRAIEALT